jgi:DNA primase
MLVLWRRPTTLERWPKGVQPGIVLSTREKGGGEAFFQKRVPQGVPEYVQTARIEFPSGRRADEICPTEIAVVAWCAQMGTITFHPWPVRREDVDHPAGLRLDLDPQPGTDFDDAVRVAGAARVLLDELGYASFPRARRALAADHGASQQEPKHQEDTGDEDSETGDAFAPSHRRFISLATKEAQQREQEAG